MRRTRGWREREKREKKKRLMHWDDRVVIAGEAGG